MNSGEMGELVGQAIGFVLLAGVPLYFAFKVRNIILKAILVFVAVVLVASSLIGRRI